MRHTCRFAANTLVVAFVLLSIVSPASAAPSSRVSYFDFGPYYLNRSLNVLGLFSIIEQLPPVPIPQTALPQPATGILPGSLFAPFEHLVENVQLATTFDAIKREELRLAIANERLSEAKTLLELGKNDQAQEAISLYQQTFADLSENVSALAKTNADTAATLMKTVEDATSAHSVVATSLALASPALQASSWSQVADSSTRALDTIADVKGEPPLPEALSQSIQTLKEQGLITPEESNKIYSFKSRVDVRDELERLTASGQFPLAETAKLDTAVAATFPDAYKQTVANLEFVELRTYQSLPQPPEDTIKEIEKWREEGGDTPPPASIRPYLYTLRAEEVAKNINLADFPPVQTAEVARFQPEAIAQNTSYTPPLPSPTLSPSPTPPQSSTEEKLPSQTATQSGTTLPSPSPIPSPTPPAAELYVGAETGSLPGDLNYNIKRWNEQLTLSFTFDPAEKARLKIQQAERRLAEATAISADPKKASLYESVLKDYQQHLTDASGLLKSAADSPSAKAVAKQLEVQAARHEAVLEKGLLPIPKDPTLISEAIKATENAMDRSADVLDRPALPTLLSQRLGDLKAQGLLLPEEVDDLTKSTSREEVREKVRKLSEKGVFPPADAKKLDEAQNLVSPREFNQLVEVRKVEELQNLRSVQTDFAQTPTLKATVVTLSRRESTLVDTIEPSLIKEEDLAGRKGLIKTYQALVATASARPINSGQFGPDVRPGVTPAPFTSPRLPDATSSTCPEGTIRFKKSEGCVWADSGKQINDYDQYRCDGPRQYYSFATKKCVPYQSGKGQKDDAQPFCPVGYTWNWPNQSCTTSPGGTIVLPTPKPDSELQTCPEGSTYKAPDSCVWNDNGRKINDADQYRCDFGRGQYYNFGQRKCAELPKVGEKYPDDANPPCKADFRWSWSVARCISVHAIPPPVYDAKNLNVPKPAITPDSPIYFVRRWGDALQLATAITPEAKEQVRISQAKERLTESLYALEKGDEKLFDQTLTAYTAKMQELYNDLAKANLSDKARKAISERLGQEAVAQNLLLQKASVLASAEQDSAIAAATSATILGVDKAADLAGEPTIPDEVRTKIEALPKEMISQEDKTALLQTNSRVKARLAIGTLVSNGALTQADASFLNEDFDSQDEGAKIKLEELQKLEAIVATQDQKQELAGKVEKNEKIVQGLNEFQKTFEVGGQIPAEIRPYVRLTRIEEVAQTIRPDIVRLDEWQNRKDVILAVATLQEEFRPTRQAVQQIQDFRRRNPGAALPSDLARIEALSYRLGIRREAGPCYLPTPPFPANTPCPAPGAAIPIASFIGSRPVDEEGYRPGYNVPSTDKDGKPFVYGQGPKSENAGVCPSGYHWMYDSGGWCMSNSGNYSSSYNYTPTGTGPGYTPYSPYYTAPGAPPATYGYTDPNFINRYSPLPGGSTYTYSPPSYWEPAPSYYTTNPPPGTVPGTGPKPTAPGQCPSGFHWMSDSGGWCMADSSTYTPGSWSGGLSPGTSTSGTPPPGGYNCGSQGFNPATGKCNDGACPGGYNWDGSKCAVPSPNLTQSSCGPGYYWSNNACFPNTPGGGGTPSSYEYGCTPGYYWDGSKCVAGNYSGGGWSDTAARTQNWCQPPSGGCGSNSYWDYGSCYCRSSSTYTGGGGPTPSNQCQGLSCGGGAWLDYSTCSCKYSGSTSGSSGGLTCYPPSAGCPGGWYDYGTCSCKTSSTPTSTGSTSGGTSTSGSCPSGYHWMDGSPGWCMSDGAQTSTYATPPTSTSTTTSTGSCPSGSHWMSDSGGYCMSDGGTTPTTSTTTTPPSEASPAPTSAPSTESSPAPTSPPEPAPTTAPTP